MIFPWVFEDFAALRGMREAAELLSRKADWGRLYDVQRLGQNTVPVACAAYFDDMCDPLLQAID